MVFVGGSRRHYQSAPDNDGTENVCKRFDGVGNQRVRMADDARHHFSCRQSGVDDHSEEGHAETALETVC